MLTNHVTGQSSPSGILKPSSECLQVREKVVCLCASANVWTPPLKVAGSQSAAQSLLISIVTSGLLRRLVI